MSDHHYEIGVLIGPCTEQEATDLLIDVADYTAGRLGAASGLKRIDDLEEWIARGRPDYEPAA